MFLAKENEIAAEDCGGGGVASGRLAVGGRPTPHAAPVLAANFEQSVGKLGSLAVRFSYRYDEGQSPIGSAVRCTAFLAPADSDAVGPRILRRTVASPLQDRDQTLPPPRSGNDGMAKRGCVV